MRQGSVARRTEAANKEVEKTSNKNLKKETIFDRKYKSHLETFLILDFFFFNDAKNKNR